MYPGDLVQFGSWYRLQQNSRIGVIVSIAFKREDTIFYNVLIDGKIDIVADSYLTHVDDINQQPSNQ